MPIEFTAYPKVPRWSRDVTVTEKLDGTNAAIRIVPLAEFGAFDEAFPLVTASRGDHAILVQSRTRFITPGKATDNYGFAGWVQENADEIVKLGPGIHYGEWWGAGIQRRYNIGEKRFSLFNVERWGPGRQERPAGCGVVPVLYKGPIDQFSTQAIMGELARNGSVAAPGFMSPEGVMIRHFGGQIYKKTFDGDAAGKEAANIA